MTAEAFPDFAVRLAETYLASSSWEKAEIGFDLLGSAALPESSFLLLDRWARASVGEYRVFNDVVDLIGHQRHASADRLLLDLHALTPPKSHVRESVLEAMIESGSASFKSVARSELSAATAVDRIVALRLFSRIGDDASWAQIHERAENDVEPHVRYAAMVYLMQREPRESAAIRLVTRASESDPDERVRLLARDILKPDKPPRLMSNWDWGSFSRSLNLSDED